MTCPVPPYLSEVKSLYEAPSELQHWLYELVRKFPNTDHVGRYSIELTGDEVFYIKNLVQTEYMLSFNENKIFQKNI